MRRALRAGLIIALVVALVAAFSFSYADESAPRGLCERKAFRYGLRLARQGSIVYAPPRDNGSKDEKSPAGVLSVAICPLFGDTSGVAPFRTRPGRADKAQNFSGSLICILVNHPHHAPPSEN